MIKVSLDTKDLLEQLREIEKSTDWEQRMRYEISKQMMPFCAPKFWHDIHRMEAGKCAQAAVKYADALIKELQKPF